MFLLFGGLFSSARRCVGPSAEQLWFLGSHALLWYEAYADAFGHVFDYQSIKRSIWRRIGSEAKRVSLFVAWKVKVFARKYYLG